jgi:hypothetical protein
MMGDGWKCGEPTAINQLLRLNNKMWSRISNFTVPEDDTISMFKTQWQLYALPDLKF